MTRGLARFARVGLAVWVVALATAASAGAQSAPGQRAPEITAGQWINSAPLSMDGLHGRVVLVEFWTFG
jgi:hypothetical protein